MPHARRSDIPESKVRVQITTPESFVGDAIASLLGHRGDPLGDTSQDGARVINAFLPDTELEAYTAEVARDSEGAVTVEVIL